MPKLHEGDISRAIMEAYHEKLSRSVESDVVIVGAGPSGLVAARKLSRAGHRVTVLEKRLTPGGGVWGGAMGMNSVVIQEEALSLLEETGVGFRDVGKGLHEVDAMELASALALTAVQAGATLLNLIFAEDLSVHGERVTGVVANRTGVEQALPVDPITLRARAVLDATGHDAALVGFLLRRGLLELPSTLLAEGPMNAEEGETFVVERAGEIFPGLFISGMAVSATLGGPRMGPIFGGMLRSGDRVARLIGQALEDSGKE